jgi:phage-related baseplate assembly protein
MSEEISLLETEANRIYNDIIEALEIYVKEPLYPGDERRIYGEALVAVLVAAYMKMNDAGKQKMLRYARGDVLDALGERTDTPRLEGKPAETVIRFTLAAPLEQNTTIPAGTIITAAGSIFFQTDETGTIAKGMESADIKASSANSGSAYNGLLPGSINTLVTLMPFIKEVKNIDVTHDGNDGEPYTEEGDNSYRERIRLSVSKFSTAGPSGAYEYYALTANADIVNAKVSSPNPGEILITVLMKDGALPTPTVLYAVEEKCSAETRRPMTDLVYAASPATVPFGVSIHYYVTAATEAAAIQAIEGENGAIAQYIAWQTSAIGRDINPDQLRKRILSPDWSEGLTGAIRANINAPIYTDINEITVAQYNGTLTVTHEVVTE